MVDIVVAGSVGYRVMATTMAELARLLAIKGDQEGFPSRVLLSGQLELLVCFFSTGAVCRI